ncbi:hypothetical protein CGRA01v4_09713 [Colletotrichum graminicola]|nr:hypothetical protein CGRA01v4_09713 [Colletotrichum graminicola]
MQRKVVFEKRKKGERARATNTASHGGLRQIDRDLRCTCRRFRPAVQYVGCDSS